MAEFLRTAGISHHIEELIIKAQEKLVLISPYLKLTDNLLERLQEKDLENIEVILVYGKSELNDFEKRKLYSLKNLSLYFYKNLHAKCYYNESSLLITSMNLHEFSEKNNREMGVLINKANDSEIYESAVQESNSIIKAADLEKKAKLSNVKDTKTVNNFEFNYEGDIPKWIKKLQSLLSVQYPLSVFSIDQYKPSITSNPFLKENIGLQIEPETGFLRITFQFHGRQKRQMYYLVNAKGKDVFEESFTNGVVGWGSQMMRVKFDFNEYKMPDLIKFDKSSLVEVLRIISFCSSQINEILN